MASPPLMSSPPPLGPTISPAITPPRITKLPSPPPPPAAAVAAPPLLPPAMSPKDHPLPPVVSKPSPAVTTPASPLTSPSPAAVAPPLPSPTVTTSPPPSSPEHPTSPPVSSPPPPSTTTTPLTPQPPPPPPPLPSTASPPLPGPPLVPSRASPPPRPTPKPTPHPPAKLSASPPPPALSPRVPPKTTISPPGPVATTPSPPPPRKSTVSRPPVSVTTPLSPTSSPATISPPPTMATPLLSPPTTSSSSFPSPPSSANGSLPTALEIQKPHPNPSRGLIFGCIIGGVVVVVLLLLVLVLGLLCMCHRRWRKRKRLGFVEHYSKLTSLGPKGDFDAVLPQQHVLPPSLLPTPCIGINVGSASTNSGSEVPNPHQAINGGVALGSSRGTFRYDQLVVATNGFSEANLVGQGGFGYVHKGVLPSGKEVAVKRLRSGSQQGEREFQAEVDTISRVHHKHLVSLVGYCITGAERLLVYEFVPNNNLEFHLHGKEQQAMDWATRLKIAIGSAKGLAYLHEDCNPTIIHRDIKAANILLDFGFEAKVSDFGLARSFSDTNTHISHISTQVVGTFGYLAPEYALSGKVTEKSDVYSYGVVLLELITGRPPIQTTNSIRNESLVEWARPLLNVAMNEGDFDGLVDPKLHQNYNANEMKRVVACAAACVLHSAWLRPRMSQIVHALEGHASLSDLQQRSSTLYSSSASSEYNARHMKMLRDQVYGISGYSDSTSEYGLNPSVSSSEAQQTI